MKTTRLFFAAALLFTIGFFTSCTEETEPIGPSIQFIAGDGYITSNSDLETGASFAFNVLLSMGDAKLDEYTIRKSNVDVAGYPKTDVSDGDKDVFSGIVSEAGTHEFTFILIDKDGLTDTKTITLTVTDPVVVPTITSYTSKIIGASANTTVGSSFASIDGNIYKLADAATNSSKIDLVYFYGATNKATLAAPADADVTGSVYPSVASWSVKNATVFELTTLTEAQFDAVENDTDITEPAGTASKVNNLTVGKVIAFKTAATSANPSKKGLIKVTGLVEGNVATGTITIAVKVQK